MSKHVFDKQKWAAMTIFEQMGNIGSEFGRAMNAKNRGDKQLLEGALYRGLDLFNLTIEILVLQKSPRLREVLLARDQFTEFILTDKKDPKLDDYFMQFAVAARLNR